MANGGYTSVTEQSWISRIFGSITSVLFGLLLFVLAFPLLWWNEGRAVRTAKSLAEGEAAVVHVDADSVNPANDGKLVQATGEATTKETLSDPEFGVSAPAIKLLRQVQMYQWQEQKKSETRDKLGGGKETVTTFSYKQDWSPKLIDSTQFHNREGHPNPSTMPFKSQTWKAGKVTLGAFTLSGAQVDMLTQAQDLPVDDKAALPEAIKARVKQAAGGYYAGADPTVPAVGDLKISFQTVQPAVVSLVAQQTGNTFEAYQAKAGNKILMVTYGTAGADEMFHTAEKNNETLAWILRGAGFLAMLLGIFLILRPIAVVADVVPILGSFVSAGLGFFAAILAACLALVTIAISWLEFRPLLAGGLLVVAAGCIVLLISRRQPKPARA